MVKKIKYCENCGKEIGKTEKTYVYKNKVVCHKCNEILKYYYG